MNWEGFGTARPVSDGELRQIIARIFGVDPTMIAIIGKLEELLELHPDQVRAGVQRRALYGEFRLWVEIWIHDHHAQKNEMETMQKLARAWDTALLVSDDSPAPSSWLRVWPDGRIEPVVIDIEAFDDRNEVVIVERKPAPESDSSSAIQSSGPPSQRPDRV